MKNPSIAESRRPGRAGKLPTLDLDRPRVVATVHSPAGLRIASGLRPGDADLLELRVDALAGQLGVLRRAVSRLRLPVLLTVRHPGEGGIGRLSTRRRRELFIEFLPCASLVDVELRSVHSMRRVIALAREQGKVVVISDHHFRSTPTIARMIERQRRAFAAGADVFKMAAMAGDPRSMARLAGFAAQPAGGRRALMAMGKFGMASRLALACAGSVLNYGYLDRPNASGQWEARELRKLLDRMGV